LLKQTKAKPAFDIWTANSSVFI